MTHNLTMNNGVVQGTIQITYHNRSDTITITCDDESPQTTVEKAQPIMYSVQTFFDTLDIDQLLLQVATEVNEACYAQSDYQPTPSDHLELAGDLTISTIAAYFDDMVMTLHSPMLLPDMAISCQITYATKKIENLEIHDA